jgi:hypothetical protein
LLFYFKEKFEIWQNLLTNSHFNDKKRSNKNRVLTLLLSAHAIFAIDSLSQNPTLCHVIHFDTWILFFCLSRQWQWINQESSSSLKVWLYKKRKTPNLIIT